MTAPEHEPVPSNPGEPFPTRPDAVVDGPADDPHEARYRAFVQQTLDAVCIYDAESKRLVETNPAFRDLLGYTEADARQLTVYDFLAPDQVRVTAYFQEIMASAPSSRSERQWRRKDGALIDVQVTASVIQQDRRPLVFVIARDITERKRAEASLRQAEQRYRDLFEDAPAMYVITRNHNGAPHITDCNHLFLSTLGYAREDVIGQPLAKFYTTTSQLRTPVSGPAPEGRLDPEERHLMTRDGRVVYTLLRAVPEIDLKGQVVGTRAMLVDITETRRAAAEVRAGALLNDLARQAASALDFRSTAQMLADQLGELTRADSCFITFWDEARQRPVPTAAYGPLREIYPTITPEPGENTVTEAVLRAGRTLVVPDVFNSPWLSPSVAARFPIRSMLAMPLTAGDRKLGAALVAYDQPHHFPPEEIALAERAAGPLALALAKARLFEELQQSHTQLTEAYDATLEGLAVALELRDKETEGHTRRVTEVTVKLARQWGVPEADLVHLRRGALLHDIGKIGIPDDILRKPGPLSADEMAVMRKHPTYAYEIISAIPFLYPAIDIPYCHHEKWDGTGYPRGLQDEAIPLAARLFAVVDVWDALRSERPYREGWPSEKVVDHIRLLSGSHFDPRVVDAFLKLLDAGI